MKNLRVGKVAITPKGEWKDGVSYEMLDAVYYNGDSYISVSDRNKSKPTDDSSWKILAKGSMDGVKVVNREWFGVFDNKNNFFTIDDNGSVTYASYAANPSEITIKNPIRIEFDGDNYQTRVYICKRDEVQGGGQPIEIDTLSTRNGKYVFEFTPNDEERKYIRIGIICSGTVNVKVSELFIMTSAYIYNGINSKVDKTDIVQSTGTSTTAVMSQKAVSDALSNVYTKEESDAMLATKQNVLIAGDGITIADDVISVDDKKFTVWSNPRIDEYVTTFTNFGYNDDGTQKTSGSSTRSWVFKIGNYGHKKVYFNSMNAWMCDGIDDSQNMINPTLLRKNTGNVDITEEHIGKYIVAMSVGALGDYLGTILGRLVQFCDEKTQAELDADERVLSDMYAGNLMRYAVSTSSINDTPTLEWGNGAYLSTDCLRNVFLDIVSRPNIGYECNVVKSLKCIYEGCGRLREITPLWNTSFVTKMSRAFYECRALERADLTHLKLPSATDLTYMFRNCIVLKEVKIPSLPSVTNCGDMFSNCTSLKSITLPELPSVTNCQSMFNGCSSLQSITLPELPAVTSCISMFMFCKKIQSLHLDMPNCENFSNFAYLCGALHTVEIVDVRKATSLSNSFRDCSSLQNVTCVEELPKCSISFNSSDKLTLESVTNIITHLPDLSGENSKTLTLHATTKALLTEALIAEATNKNWIIA